MNVTRWIPLLVSLLVSPLAKRWRGFPELSSVKPWSDDKATAWARWTFASPCLRMLVLLECTRVWLWYEWAAAWLWTFNVMCLTWLLIVLDIHSTKLLNTGLYAHFWQRDGMPLEHAQLRLWKHHHVCEKHMVVLIKLRRCAFETIKQHVRRRKMPSDM